MAPRIRSTNHDELWREHAACRDAPLYLFFPDDEETSGGPRWGNHFDEAKAICNACPVKGDCLEYALANFIRHGVWGGTTEKDRRRILRQRRLAADAGNAAPEAV